VQNKSEAESVAIANAPPRGPAVPRSSASACGLDQLVRVGENLVCEPRGDCPLPHSRDDRIPLRTCKRYEAQRDAVATSERLSGTIDSEDVATMNSAETVREFRDTRYGEGEA